MTRLRFTKIAPPATPAAQKIEFFSDLNDVGRVKYIDGDTGLTRILTSTEWPKNHLINGGFNFAQRQVAGTLTTYSNLTGRSYGADRWGMTNENASIQYQQIDTITAPETGIVHRYYGRFKKITNAGKISIAQVMSAENTAVLRSERVRVQVWMKRTVAASLVVNLGLIQLTAAGTHDTIPATFISAFNGNGTDPTLGTNLSRLTPVANTADGGTIVGNKLQCTLTGSWQRFSVVFDCPSDMKNLIWTIWSDNQLAISDELNVAQTILTDGPEIVQWISLPQIQELDRCARFYQKSFALATAPAQNAGLTGAWRGSAAQAGAVSFAHAFIEFAVPMRAVPAITFYNPSAVNAFLRATAQATDATATSATQITERGTEVTATGLAAWVKGDGIAIHFQADAEL